MKLNRGNVLLLETVLQTPKPAYRQCGYLSLMVAGIPPHRLCYQQVGLYSSDPLTGGLLPEKGACGPHSLSRAHRGQLGAQQASLAVCEDRQPGGEFGTPHDTGHLVGTGESPKMGRET